MGWLVSPGQPGRAGGAQSAGQGADRRDATATVVEFLGEVERVGWVGLAVGLPLQQSERVQG